MANQPVAGAQGIHVMGAPEVAPSLLSASGGAPANRDLPGSAKDTQGPEMANPRVCRSVFKEGENEPSGNSYDLTDDRRVLDGGGDLEVDFEPFAGRRFREVGVVLEAA